MTTIVYKDGVLAAESFFKNEAGIFEEGNKLHYTPNKLAAFGVTGSTCKFTIEEIGEMLEANMRGEDVDYKELNLLVMVVGGVFIIKNNHMCTNDKCGYMAIGSGMYYAYVAMLEGYTAEEAVQFAVDYDPLSGGAVSIVKEETLTNILDYKKGVKDGVLHQE